MQPNTLSYIKESAPDLIIEVKTKPNAKQARLEELEDGTWIAHVQAPPVDGKANAKLTSMIAEHFGVPKRNVTILTGATSKRKRVEIEIENQKEPN